MRFSVKDITSSSFHLPVVRSLSLHLPVVIVTNPLRSSGGRSDCSIGSSSSVALFAILSIIERFIDDSGRASDRGTISDRTSFIPQFLSVVLQDFFCGLSSTHSHSIVVPVSPCAFTAVVEVEVDLD